MKTRLSEYDVNKLRSAAKEINDILYDIPEGNFDLEKVRIGNHVKADYDDTTSHPVFGKDLPWEKTEMVNIDIDTQIPMKFGNPSSPFEGKVESWHNPDMNKSMVEPLEYYKVCYSPNDIKMVIAILKNEKEIIAGKIERHETGHFYTTCNGLQFRIEELEKELEKMEQKPIYKPLTEGHNKDMIEEEDFKYSGC